MAALALLTDLLIAVLTAVIIFIAATGGGVYTVAGVRLSLRGIDNPLAALAVLVAVRYLLRRHAPFLAVRRLSLDGVDDLTASGLARAIDAISRIEDVTALRIVWLLVASAIAVRVFNAWRDPGFFSGDDVEVHAMTLSALWQAGWRAWDLRNAAFPFAFVFPAQWLASQLGASDPRSLVFAGRVPIIVGSSLSIWLVWRAGRAWRPDDRAIGLIAAGLLWVNGLHMAFGSSELPRPIATVFVLGAFLLLRWPSALAAIGAGIALGIAAALRFSEALFVAAAAVHLAWRRDVRQAMLLVVSALAIAALVLGLADVWYWREPFHSLRAAIDFTLVRRLSSRGYEPPFWYLAHCADWVNPVLLIAAVVWLARRRDPIGFWIAVPLVVLSLLPHKEARYAIPAVPFVMLGAGAAIVELARDRGRPRWVPPVLIAALMLGTARDVAHWRLPRTNAEVRLAARLAAMLPPGSPVAIEQAWRAGAPVYFRGHETIDLDPALLPQPDYLWERLPSTAWVALDVRRPYTPALAASLASRGYVAVLDDPDAHYRVWRPFQ